MKLPQLEDGFTRVSNPIMDAWIRHPKMPPTWRIQLYVARRSWGFGRATADLKPKNFVKACGISHKNIHKYIKRAIEENLIYTIHAEGISGVRYKVSKKFSKWFMPSGEKVPSSQKKNTFQPEGTLFSLKKRKKKNIYSLDPYEPNPKKPNAEFAYRIRVPFPPSMKLTDRMRAYALTKEIEPERVAAVYEHFCTHHGSLGSTFKDWGQAWQTWCQNDLKFKKDREKKPSEDAFDAIKRELTEGRSIGESGDLPQQGDR